jgi:hypothetical protein
VQRARCIYSRFPWHDRQLSHTLSDLKHKIIDVPIFLERLALAVESHVKALLSY